MTVDAEPVCAWPTCGRVARGRYCVAHAARARLGIPMDSPIRLQRTPEQWASLVTQAGKLRGKGLSYEMIARRLGVSQSTAAKAGKEAGFIGHTKGPIRHGIPARWMEGCRCTTCSRDMRAHKVAEREAKRAAAQAALDSGGHLPGHLCPCPQCRAKDAAKLAARLDRTRSGATAHRQPWTEADVETAMRDDLTIEELAALLGRTYAAIDNKRREIGRARGLA